MVRKEVQDMHKRLTKAEKAAYRALAKAARRVQELERRQQGTSEEESENNCEQTRSDKPKGRRHDA